jgi:hypothetical protein
MMNAKCAYFVEPVLLSLSISTCALAQTLPTLAIDEGHFNVHKAGTTYRPFADLARAKGLAVISHTGRFSLESLSRLTVLVISNARSAETGPLADRGRPAFSPEEVDVVVDWVRAGGALLLVIDHYPIGGANRGLAARFGLDVLDGRTEDPMLSGSAIEGRVAGGAAGEVATTKTIIFERMRSRITDHPIMCGTSPAERIDRVATFDGASLDAPEGVKPLLLFSDDAIDYVGAERLRRSAAGRNQGVALTFGKGKVAVLGEAAMLFNLDDASVQNRQFAINLLHWLAGRLDSARRTGCHSN